MENNTEKQQNKRPFVKEEGQKFYFNEEGKLVVESNKGVWVDGEPHVKMYGNFTCNAKTLGIIINKFKGCPVIFKEVKSIYKFTPYQDLSEVEAIVNPTEYDKELQKPFEQYKELSEKEIKELKDVIVSKDQLVKIYIGKINKFNNLPWWKRMFKRIDI